jgi:K+-transporting ATPase KdpF subunit
MQWMSFISPRWPCCSACRGIRQWLRPPDRRPRMSLLTILAGLAAGGLLVYLIAALLFPEDFS